MTKQTIGWARVARMAIPLLLTVLWIGFIFSNSMRDGAESDEQSHSVQEVIDAIFDSVGLDNPVEEGPLRKLAHFGEFAVLALLYIGDWFGLGRLSLSSSRSVAFFRLFSAVPLCFLTACVDEFIQRFSAGRAPQLSDVLIDTAGALVATLVAMGIFYLLRAILLNRKSSVS